MIQAALDLRLCELVEVLEGFLATSEEILLKTRRRSGDTRQLPVSTASGADRMNKMNFFPKHTVGFDGKWLEMLSQGTITSTLNVTRALGLSQRSDALFIFM